MLALDLKSLITFREGKRTGDQPHRKGVELHTMFKFDTYSKQCPTLWLVSLLMPAGQKPARLPLFRDADCFLIASMVSAYSLWQRLLRVVADGSTRSSRYVICDRRSTRFDIVFHGI